jgi:MATE family multidrug resistance protein
VIDLLEILVTPAPAIPPAARPRAWTVEARALAMLAAPLIITQLAQMATMTTDVFLLGRLSQTALAAAAIGNTVFYFAWLVGGGPASAVSPMIAHILGARERDRAGVRGSLRMGLWAIAITSAPMMLVMWETRPILLALGQAPALAAQASLFVRALTFGLPFALGFLVLRNFANALGRPRAPMWVMGATIAWNALAGYALIFGHFGAPRLGIVGSGIATASSALFSFLAMLLVIQLTPAMRRYRLFRRFTRPVRARLAEVFRLGMPIGMTMIFEAMMFNCMTLVMGRFGTASLAAHQIALNFASITFMVPLGLGMASTVRVGLAMGAGDPARARQAGLTAMALSVAFMIPCGLIMVLFGSRIAGLYLGGRTGADAAVIAMAGLFMKAAAAFQVFDALQVVGAQSLRGLKDARMPMILAGASYWLVGIPTCLLLGLVLDMRGLGIWIGFVVALGVAALLLCLRFQRLTRTG